MRLAIFWFLLLTSHFSLATEISVGGVSLVVPNPNGFSPVTPKMLAIRELQQQLVAPSNVEFAAVIPAKDVPAATDGQITDLTLRFSVQTAKSVVDTSVSSLTFARLKTTIRSEQAELVKRAESQSPALLKKFNDGIANKGDVDRAMAVSKVMPLPIHEETDHSLAYSSFVKYEMNDAKGQSDPFVAVFTVTFLHVKDKVLFLYAFADDAGLEWSREASRQWAHALVMQNSVKGDVAKAQTSAVSESQFDWAIMEMAVAGAIGAALVGFFVRAVLRRRSQ